LTFSSPTTNSNPAVGTSPAQDALYAKSLPKAWGSFTIPATAGSDTSLTLDDGFNFDTAITRGGLGIELNFHTAFADDNYCVVASSDHLQYSIRPNNNGSVFTRCNLLVVDTATKTAEDVDALPAAPCRVTFVVFGEQ
jgi:hypothetical protein